MCKKNSRTQESQREYFSLRYVAKKVGLAGKTDEDFVQADMILEHTNDFWRGIHIYHSSRLNSRTVSQIWYDVE